MLYTCKYILKYLLNALNFDVYTSQVKKTTNHSLSIPPNTMLVASLGFFYTAGYLPWSISGVILYIFSVFKK